MIGPTLGLYFLRRYAVITFWNFVGISALLFLVNITEISARSAGLPGYSTAWALSVAALQIPIVMQQAVPFVGLIAAMATLISLNRKHELVIARSAGISAWEFLTPIMTGALIFGILSVTLLNPVATAGFRHAQELEAEVTGAHTRVNREARRWLKQRTAEGTTIIGADAALDGGKTLVRPVFLRIDDSGHIFERLDARRAQLRDGYWELDDVSRLRGQQPPEHADTLTLPTNLHTEFVAERLTSPEAVSIFELPRTIKIAHSFGMRASAFATEFQSLLATPPLLVAMSLIAATVSMRFARMGLSATMILGGILAGFLLYVVSALAEAFGSAGFVPPVVAAWTPVVIAMFVGVTFLLYKEDG